MTDQRVFIKSRLRIKRKLGTMPPLKSMVINTNTYKNLRPGNAGRLSTYPSAKVMNMLMGNPMAM